MNKLIELSSLCNGSVSITINLHKDYKETVEQHLKDDKEDIDDDVYNEMVKRDFIVKLHVYPYTSIGSYSICHYDIDKMIDNMIELIKKERKFLSSTHYNL
jgi:hypothetical protein